MKSKLGFWGFLLIVVGGMVMTSMAGCENGTTNSDENGTINNEEPSKFDGKWKLIDEEYLAIGGNVVYTFSGTIWQFTSTFNDSSFNRSLAGTFTDDGATIYFTATSGGTGSWNQGYTLLDDELTLTSGGPDNLTLLAGTFKKQPQ
jgi:hypothetical protein